MPKKIVSRKDKHGLIHRGTHLDDSPGKGDGRRPSRISREEFERRWEQTFGGDDEQE
jgi:hypothetical protein